MVFIAVEKTNLKIKICALLLFAATLKRDFYETSFNGVA